jgi:hypothetical protein
MDDVPKRMSRWWRGMAPNERRQATALALISLVYVIHYLVYCLPQPFFIEDAAITFSYARNLVDGEGLVTYPGGERVEGFSNPLWTFLIAGFYALGVPTWTSSKVMGAIFGVMTLPMAFDTVRKARPGGSEDVALVAPLLLALSPQFVIWNASGLENSLFCVLLSAGVWRLLCEMQGESKRPWSALLFALLAMTRPEGIVYAVFGLLALGMDAVATRRIKPILQWTVSLLVPFALYQFWRYQYFAWEMPNTYYAKLHQGTPFRPFGWTVKGWKYVNKHLVNYGIVYAIPVIALGLTGLRRWRRWLWVFLLVVLSALILWDGKAGLDRLPDWWRPFQKQWMHARVWAIAASAVTVGLATFGRPGWRGRGLLWLNLCFGVFFALYSGGDWMKGFRWFNMTSVAMFPLIAIGLGELMDGLPVERIRIPRGPSLRSILVVVPTLALGGVGIYWTTNFASGPETSVRDVHRRVRYMTWVQRRLDVDHVDLLDVDMGAHMFFSGWNIVDMAGLVDVPIARHKDYDKRFIRHYVFEEFNPTFAHVHSGWANTTKIPRHKEWKARYLEIPGYSTGGRRLHVGNHVRRDLFIHDVDEPLPDSAIHFEGGVRLIKVEVPSPVVPTGGLLFVDTQWAARFRKGGFRILAILDNGGTSRTVQALAPGYDWYLPKKWKLQERVDGKFRVPIPEDLAHGEYTLSFLLLDEKTGLVIPAEGTAGALRAAGTPDQLDGAAVNADAGSVAAAVAEPAEPAAAEGEETPVGSAALPPASGMGDGEWNTGIVVTVTSRKEAIKAAGGDYAWARAHADDGNCEKSWASFKDATRHVLRDLAWKAKREPLLRTEIAGCWIQRADDAEDRDAQVDALVQARFWDRHHDILAERTEPLAETLAAEADGLSEAEDWDAAYAAYAQAMKLDPSRSWTRRSAEVARDHMLGILGDDDTGDAGDEEDEKIDRSRKEGKNQPSWSGKRSGAKPKRSSGKSGRDADVEADPNVDPQEDADPSVDPPADPNGDADPDAAVDGAKVDGANGTAEASPPTITLPMLDLSKVRPEPATEEVGTDEAPKPDDDPAR